MDGPGPSTQANVAARATRATRRAPGEAVRSAPESQTAQFPNREPGADDSSAEGDERSDDGDDSEDDGEKLFHHQIWKELLRKGSKNGILRYVNGQPKTGNDPLDITAVEESQITWDMNDRRFWPKNLTLFERPHPWKTPTYDIDVMRYKGRIVHDHNGDPIRNFRIPLTISSKVEGLRMESWMRSDDRLTLGDIEARVFTKDGRGGEKVPVFDKRALSKRASNARTRAGLISWVTKKGTEKQKRYLRDLRTKTQDESNPALGRDLTSKEKAHHAWLSLNEGRISHAPTRANRIQKILRTAGKSGTVAGPSAGAANAGPSDSVAAASGDDDDLTDDTDGDEAAPETQIRDQASDSEDTDDKDSVSSSLIDPLDSRHDEPTNPEEEACLRDALANTVEEFVFLVDQEPQPTNPGDNYFSQWGALQEQFRAVWAALGNEVEAPRLRARDRWTGGISQWYFAEEIEAADDEEPE